MNSTVEYYNQNAENFIRTTLPIDMSSSRDRFLRHVLPGGRVLDAGCGSGRDALAFQKAGYQTDAFDASEEMCRHASKLLGLPVACRRFEELSGEAEYDGIWACASLIHVNSSDLPDVLLRLYALLKPGGVIYASFKEGSTERMQDGRYFHDLTEEACRGLFQNAGFSIEELYISFDANPSRADVRWINIIAKKGTSQAAG